MSPHDLGGHEPHGGRDDLSTSPDGQLSHAAPPFGPDEMWHRIREWWQMPTDGEEEYEDFSDEAVELLSMIYYGLGSRNWRLVTDSATPSVGEASGHNAQERSADNHGDKLGESR